MKYSGSCLCGNVKYEITGNFEHFFSVIVNPVVKIPVQFMPQIFSSTAKLRWLKGEKEVRTYNHNNSGHIKSFCPNCSSALPNIQMDGNLVVVPAGSLDSDIDIIPTGHIYLEEKANWDRNIEDVPHYEKLPTEEPV